MKRALLAAIFSFTRVATAVSDLFGVHLVTAADAPGAETWRMLLPGGAVEIVPLDSAALLDATAIAAADVEPSPDGGSQIRLVLTAEGARRLAEITSRNVGRRLGIVVAGRLRAAPHVRSGITDGVLVVGGLRPGEAETLARALGPPSASTRTGPGAASVAAADPDVLRVLDGTWTLLSATANSLRVPDVKFSRGTWVFQGGTLTATNGVGDTARFAIATDAGARNSFRLDPVAPSTERAGWMIFRRDGERLTIAFVDGFVTRPADFAPAPKKVVLELARTSSR